MSEENRKRLIRSIPYLIIGVLGDKLAWLYRVSDGISFSEKLMFVLANFGHAFRNPFPSFFYADVLVGLASALLAYALIYIKQKDAKKFRQGMEYGSARWGTAADIKPYMDSDPDNNIILTDTERLTMNSRPANPKYSRNKNVLVIGGSGSGKTRSFVKPNLMQMHSSYCVTDPKGTILVECGKMLERGGYQIRVLNTVNFRKSMHYNPFVYIRSEKDILKLVNTIIANTKSSL